MPIIEQGRTYVVEGWVSKVDSGLMIKYLDYLDRKIPDKMMRFIAVIDDMSDFIGSDIKITKVVNNIFEVEMKLSYLKDFVELYKVQSIRI